MGKIKATYKPGDDVPTPGPGESIDWKGGVGTHYEADPVSSKPAPFRGETVDPYDTYKDNMIDRGLWRERRGY